MFILLNILIMINFCNTIQIGRRKYLQKCLLSTHITFSKSTTFPYKFGGLHQESQMFPSNDMDVNARLMKTLFDENILSNFAVAYRNILKGLHQKDKEYLDSFLQKNLTKNIRFPETDLINPQAQIEVKIGKINTVVYGCFDRQILSQYDLRLLIKTDDQQLTTYIAQDKQKSLSYKTSLFCFHVYFKSAMKLNIKAQNLSSTNQVNQPIETEKIKNEQKSNHEQKEIHMVQFQIQSKVTSFELVKKGSWIFFKNFFNRYQMALQLGQLILGNKRSDFQWKIGDIDRALQGNYTQPGTQNKNQ